MSFFITSHYVHTVNCGPTCLTELQILSLESYHPSSDKVPHPRPHSSNLHETLIPDAHVLCHHVWPVGRGEGTVWDFLSERYNERVGEEDRKVRKDKEGEEQME